MTVLGFQSLGYDDCSRETGLVNRSYEILRLYQRTGRVREEQENRYLLIGNVFLYLSGCHGYSNVLFIILTQRKLVIIEENSTNVRT